MGQLGTGASTTAAPARGAAGGSRDGALDAVRRLAGASAAEAFSVDRLTGGARSLLSTGPRADLDAPALRDAARVQTALILGDPRPRWVAGRGAAASLLVRLADRGAGTLFLLLAFDDASAAVRARVEALAPDLATLIRFHLDQAARTIELEEVGAAATAALDHGECGVIAIREDRSVVFRNAAAAAYLDAGVGLQVRRGRLGAIDGRRFDAALQAILDAPGAPAARPPAAAILLKRAGTARPVVAVVAPARPAPSAAARPTGVAALVYLLDPSRGGLRGMETLCRLHGLSGVESRLLAHLAGGMTLSDAAADMRIKLETARTYLKQIFAKTGVHRQTDLVAMMSRYLRAFRGDFDFRPA